LTVNEDIYILHITECNLHFVNMREIMIVTMLSVGMMGCQALSPRPSLKMAEENLQEGELYRARKTTQAVLKRQPSNPEAQALMARIIDREIERHKELFETQVVEEMEDDVKSEEVRTWLERGETLYKLKQYDEAVLATEKVFLYDPDNARASRLIDKIRGAAIKEGKQELTLKREFVRTEIRGRVSDYIEQARRWMAEGKWGAAKLAVEKTLLLEPDHQEAREMQKKIRKRLASPEEKLGAKTGASGPSEPIETMRFR
jgi:tetratricopeptide (TPR) repeat protein